jgi:two-component system, chemotaxis family, response regulator Rcp1
MSTAPHTAQTLHPDLGRPIELLLVEDSPSDVAMTREALREARVANHLNVVEDGEAAMSYLRREGAYADATRPDLIILDLNLPKKDGLEVLAEVKNDASLKAIPVVILTTSSADGDILRSYELSASSYLTKPVGFEPFLAVVRGLEDFWLGLAHLPHETP